MARAPLQRPKRDLTGQKFGSIVVDDMTRTAKSIKGEFRCICTCTLCGKNGLDISPQALRRGMTKSCGCDKSRYDKMRGSNSPSFNGHGEISGHNWSHIKRRAEARGLTLDLTIEQAWNLFLQQGRRCALTGLPLTMGTGSKATASIDRIKSEGGYVLGNVQWVLKAVNIMKNSYPQDIFVAICSLVAKQHPNPTVNQERLCSTEWNNHTARKASDEQGDPVCKRGCD